MTTNQKVAGSSPAERAPISPANCEKTTRVAEKVARLLQEWLELSMVEVVGVHRFANPVEEH
jgi:hypothetical protein